jgi:hypothetical protein
METRKPASTLPGQSHESFARTSDQQSLPTMPRYETPYIISYTDQDILEELGPALTGGGSGPNHSGSGLGP